MNSQSTSPTLRRRNTSHASSATSTSHTPSPRVIRTRSSSCYPTAREPTTSSLEYGSYLLESLDLSGSIPGALWSLKEYLLGRLEEAEEGVRALKALVEESESDGGGEDDGEEWEVVERKGRKGKGRSATPPGAVNQSNENAKAAISTLEQFIQTASGFLTAVRAELPSLSALPSSTPSLSFELSPDARLALDHFLQDHPLPSFPQLPQLDLRARLDNSKRSATTSANALLSRVSSELSSLQELLTHLTASTIPSMPSLPLPTPPLPLHALRDYFSAESERLSLSLSSSTLALRTLGTETTDALHAGVAHLREEATELTHAAFDEASRMYHAALEGGRKRLLRYEELPHEWRNNEHILSGYRYIAIERWGVLLRSAFEWHNETINIQSHLLGFLSLIYLLIFLLPDSPHSLPNTHPADTAIALLFVVAAMKCLICSAAWHLLSGCATGGWHRGAACVDYVGISALIAASVMGMEYYGFYCRMELAGGYMAFSAVLGMLGMVLPWKPWFNQRKYKMWRISFFVGLGLSALLPMAHMAVLYGVKHVVSFFMPVVPSVMAYLIGLSFYANQFPEMMAPGRWDNLFASHQLWHAAIVVAVWMHWRALNIWASGAVGGDELSCSVRA